MTNRFRPNRNWSAEPVSSRTLELQKATYHKSKHFVACNKTWLSFCGFCTRPIRDHAHAHSLVYSKLEPPYSSPRMRSHEEERVLCHMTENFVKIKTFLGFWTSHRPPGTYLLWVIIVRVAVKNHTATVKWGRPGKFTLNFHRAGCSRWSKAASNRTGAQHKTEY